MSDKYALAYNTWQEKTEWVQIDKRFDVLLPWGKHRADVLKEYIEHIEAKLDEALRYGRQADATIHNLELKITDMAVQLANAESKCRELAAELSAVDKIHNEAVFITDDHYEQCPPEVQKMIRSLAVLQIPAYDAFLAEVRVSAVEEFLRDSQLPYQIATVLADYDNAVDATLQTVIWSGQPPEPDGDVWHLEYVSRGNAIVRAVLKKLRKGAAL